MLRLNRQGELRRELELWRGFETAAWRTVDRVVTMSEQDRRVVVGTTAVSLPNGVDLERFQPAASEPEPRRLLFIGSFAHRPDVMAGAVFLRQAGAPTGRA